MNPFYPLPQTSPGGLGSYTEVVVGDLSSCCPPGLPCREKNNTNPSGISHNCKSKVYILSIDVYLQTKPQRWQQTQVSASDSFLWRNFLMTLKKYGQVTASGSSLCFYLILEFGSNSCANLMHSSVILIFIFWSKISIEQWLSKYGAQTSSISITWTFVREASSLAPPRPCIRSLGDQAQHSGWPNAKLKVWNRYLGWLMCPHLEGFLSLSSEPTLCCPVPQGPPCMERSLSCLLKSFITYFFVESELQLDPLPSRFTIISACNIVAYANYGTWEICIEWVNYAVHKTIKHSFGCRHFTFSCM